MKGGEGPRITLGPDERGELGSGPTHSVDNEALLTICRVFKFVDKILKLLDPGELFFNTKVSNLYQSFLVFNSHVNSTKTNSMFHVHRVSLVLDSIESLSSEHSAKHHHVRRTLPAVDRIRTR